METGNNIFSSGLSPAVTWLRFFDMQPTFLSYLKNRAISRSLFTSLTKRAKAARSPHLHAEYSLGVALQRAQQQAVLGVSYADGAVVGPDQKQPPGSFLSRVQTAHRSGALKHIQLFESLARQGRM